MSYVLGIDLGTTFSAAAVVRDGRAEVVNLGNRSAQIPTVVFVDRSGEVIVGEAAERLAATDPSRVAREFKRRLGDTTPLFLGGAPFGADALTSTVLRAIHDRVCDRMGGRPTRVVVTHPAAYTRYRLDLLRSAAAQAGIERVELLPEPTAAAIQYAATSDLAVGEIVAVYDFGGGTFDTALLRRLPNGFEALGEPQGLEHLGGIDIDAAVVQHVDDQLGGELSALDASDPTVAALLGRLSTDARAAKETLSEASSASVAVVLPGISRQVSLSRQQIESMLLPRLAETVQALQRAARSAGIEVDRISRVLLVGGTSRIPLIRRHVATTTGRPIASDIDPEFAVVLGAARHAAALESGIVAGITIPLVSPPRPAPPSMPAARPEPPTPLSASAPPIASAPPTPPVPPAPSAVGPPTGGLPFTSPSASPAGDVGRRRLLVGAAALVVAALVGVGILVANRGGSSAATTTVATSDAAGTGTSVIDVATTTEATTAPADTLTTDPATTAGDTTPASDSTTPIAPVTTSGSGATSGPPALPIALPAQVSWAGWVVTNESLTLGDSPGTVVWRSSWRNVSPATDTADGSAVELHLGGQTAAATISGGVPLRQDTPTPIQVVFTGLTDAATAPGAGAALVLGSSDQHQAILALDGTPSSSDFLIDVPIQTVIDLGSGVQLQFDDVQFVRATCLDGGLGSLTLAPAGPDVAAVVLRGGLTSPAGNTIQIDGITLGIPEVQSFTPVEQLVNQPGTTPPVLLCFDIDATTATHPAATQFAITVALSGNPGGASTANGQFEVPRFADDPCLLLTKADIEAKLSVTVTGPPIDVTTSAAGFIDGPMRACSWSVTTSSGDVVEVLLADVVNGDNTFGQATAGTPAFAPIDGVGTRAAFATDAAGFSELVAEIGQRMIRLQVPGSVAGRNLTAALAATIPTDPPATRTAP